MTGERVYLDLREVEPGHPHAGLLIPLRHGRHDMPYDVDHARLPGWLDRKVRRAAREKFQEEKPHIKSREDWPVGVRLLPPGAKVIRVCRKCARDLDAIVRMQVMP